MSTLDMSQADYYAWLADNRVTLGGTDVAAIVGADLNRTPADVFDSKLRLRPPVQRNRDMDRGVALEDIAARIYAAESEAVVSPMAYLRHPEHPFIGGTPDRSIDQQPGYETSGILEIKCPREYGYEQTLLHGVSPSYHCQLQWYLGLSGRTWGAFGIFNAERWELHRVSVEFLDGWYASALDCVVRFWHDHILTRTRPSGELSRQEILASELPRVGAEWETVTTPEFVQACHSYASAKESEKLASEHVKRAQARLEALMPPGSKWHGGGFRVTYLEHGRRTPDLEWLKREHPEIDIDRYVRQSVYRQLRLIRGS